MTLKRMVFLGIALALTVAFMPELADAQSWKTKPTSAERTGPRLMFMFAVPILGFCLGWLLSAQAKSIRQYIWYGLIALFAAVAIWGGVFWGWSATILVGIIGFCLAFGFWSKGNKTPTTHGSSRWATTSDLGEKDVLGNEGILLGKFYDGKEEQPISYKGDRHLLTIAPTRSGKGTTQIIPNLLTYEGSMLVIDPKGENALISAKRRQDMGQDVHIVDPWGIAKVEGVRASKLEVVRLV